VKGEAANLGAVVGHSDAGMLSAEIGLGVRKIGGRHAIAATTLAGMSDQKLWSGFGGAADERATGVANGLMTGAAN
jgi:hypothetical protein